MYKVDKAAGSAKFDKSRKTLTIRVPVVGSTDDSQRVLDQHYRAYKENLALRNEQLKMLQKSKLEEDQEARRVARKNGKEVLPDVVENDENDGDKSNSMQQAVREFEEAAYGVSKPKVIQMEGDIIDDKYNVQTEVDKNKLFAEDDSEKSKREDFLKIFKENEKKQKNAEPESNLDSNIRFRQEEDEDQDFKLNTSA